MARHFPKKPGQTDAEYADALIARGQFLQARAENYRQDGQFHLYSRRGRQLNSDAVWLIQTGLAMKKKL